MIHINGSRGEGGGQILRTALSLSLLTGKPFHITQIRAGRAKPGLLRQHLTAVKAAAEIGSAEVNGAEPRSAELTFRPGKVKPGRYHFAVGTAGSANLVLQTILPPLMVAKGPSELVLEGGTHNGSSPPFEFLAWSFLPLIQRMGPKVEIDLERPGYYPAGGGRMVVTIDPVDRLSPIRLEHAGDILNRRVRARCARLPVHIAENELKICRGAAELEGASFEIVADRSSHGPGNALVICVERKAASGVFTGFGQKGVSGQKVATDALEQMKRWLRAGVPVDEHLADQLLVPMAMSGSGSFVTNVISQHFVTNVETISRFLDTGISQEKLTGKKVRVALGSPAQTRSWPGRHQEMVWNTH